MMTKSAHQPVVAVIAEIIMTVREFFFVVLFLFFGHTRSMTSRLIVIVGLILLAILFGVLRWWFFTYDVTPHEITLKKGVFIRKYVHMPFERIQTITRTQPFYFQPFDVYRVSIETSGKKDDRLVFSALRLTQIEVIEQYRQQSQTKTTESKEVPKADHVYHIQTSELVVFALTSLGSLGIFGALATVISELSMHMPQDLVAKFDHWFSGQTFAGYIMILAVILIVSLVIAFARIYNRYYHFTLTRFGVHLAITQGLLTKKEIQLRLSRIQAVHYEQSLLRRWVNLATINVLLASSGRGDKEKQDKTTIIPVVSSSKAYHVLSDFLPSYRLITPKKAIGIDHAMFYERRYEVLMSLIYLTLPTVIYFGCAYVWHWPTIYSVIGIFILSVLIIYVMICAAVRMTDQRLVIEQETLTLQTSQWLTKHVYTIPRDKIQGAKATQSYFMIKSQAQHLRVIIRNGDGAKMIDMRYLPEAEVKRIVRWITHVK